MQDVPMDDQVPAVRESSERSQADRELVSAVLVALAERIGKDRYEVWFGGHTRLTMRSQGLLVEAPSRFHQDWLRNHFRRDLEQVLVTVLQQTMPLEFGVDSTLQPSTSSPSKKKSHSKQQPALFEDLEPENTEQMAETSSEVTLPVATKPKRSKSQPDGMVAPVLRQRRWNSLSSFVVGSCNRLAHAVIMQVAEAPCEPNPVLLYGGTSTGKTHLLEGLVAQARQADSQRNCVFLTAEQFTSQFLEGLHGRGLPLFRRKYRSVDLLVIDDIQFLAGKQATLTEFLHTLDTLLREHRQVVISADRPAHELHELGQQLSTRLAGGLCARLESPDYATRQLIIRQLASKQGLELNDDLVELLATQLSEHVRELQGAVQRLALTTRMTGRTLTIPEAETALAELLHRRGHNWNLIDIEKAVCHALGLPTESLQSERRAKSLNTPRMLAMWLARKYTRAALSEIGQYFGKRSHSTVISAQKKVGGWVNEQTAVTFGSKTWPIEEAIRRVEETLRATG